MSPSAPYIILMCDGVTPGLISSWPTPRNGRCHAWDAFHRLPPARGPRAAAARQAAMAPRNAHASAARSFSHWLTRPRITCRSALRNVPFRILKRHISQGKTVCFGRQNGTFRNPLAINGLREEAKSAETLTYVNAGAVPGLRSNVRPKREPWQPPGHHGGTPADGPEPGL